MSLSKYIKHIVSFKLPPKDAIEYLKKKGYKLTFNYKELEHQAHHKAFTVAKIQRLDLLADIKEAIIKAKKEGYSFNQFKKEIKPTLIKKGWWGEVEAIDKKTGEVKTINVNTNRLKTIFYTNSRVAYQVQKAKKYYEDDSVEYLRYIAILDNKVRPSHKTMHGKILPKNHPFWEKNFPPNGWNCRCRVRAVSKFSAKKYKDKIKESLEYVKNNPLIADNDWAYDVREGRFFDKFNGGKEEIQAFSNYKDFNLSSFVSISKDIFSPSPKRLNKAKNKKEALSILKKALLQNKDKQVLKTPITDVLIDTYLIEHIVKEFDTREEFANFIIPTLKEPDEIWAQKVKTNKDKYFKKRYRYIKLFKDKKDNFLAVVEIKRDLSLFWTFFKISNLKQIDKRREGILMYVDRKFLSK